MTEHAPDLASEPTSSRPTRSPRRRRARRRWCSSSSATRRATRARRSASSGGAGGPARQAPRTAGVDLYVHAPYIVNVATTNNRIRIPSRKLLQQHMDAAAEIGAKGLIVHGGHVNKDDDPAKGFDNWRKAIEATDIKIPLLIENTAGGDNAMTRHLDRIAGCGTRSPQAEGVRARRVLPRHLPRLGGRHRAAHRRREGARDHRPDRPGARQRQPRRLRLRRRPARQLRRRPARRGRLRRPSSVTPGRRSSARHPEARPSTRPTSPGCASTASEHRMTRLGVDRRACSDRSRRWHRAARGCGAGPTSRPRRRRGPSPMRPLRRATAQQYVDVRRPASVARRLGPPAACCCTAATGRRPTAPSRWAAGPRPSAGLGYATANVEYRRVGSRRWLPGARSRTSTAAIDRLARRTSPTSSRSGHSAGGHLAALGCLAHDRTPRRIAVVRARSPGGDLALAGVLDLTGGRRCCRIVGPTIALMGGSTARRSRSAYAASATPSRLSPSCPVVRVPRHGDDAVVPPSSRSTTSTRPGGQRRSVDGVALPGDHLTIIDAARRRLRRRCRPGQPAALPSSP